MMEIKGPLFPSISNYDGHDCSLTALNSICDVKDCSITEYYQKL
jgi:hypothetical protein